MICVIGDIASGKSTVAQLLAEKLPGNFIVLSIDEFRRQYNPEGNIVGEMYAVQKLNEAVLASDKIILDSTGTSKYYPVLVWDFQTAGGITHVAKLTCSILTALTRQEQRARSPDYSPAPFAYAYKFTIQESIKWVHKKLDSVKADATYNTEELTPEQIAEAIAQANQTPKIPLSTALAKMNILASQKRQFQLAYTTTEGKRKTVLAEIRGNHIKRTDNGTLPILEWSESSGKMVYRSPKISLLGKLNGAIIEH